MNSIFARIVAAALSLALIVPPTFCAYEVPLSDRSVREAYFLGQRRDEKTGQFLKDYTKFLPFPKTGPHVSEITLFTPYAHVVELSRQNSSGYSAQQAGKAYRESGDKIYVRVRLGLTATYTSIDTLKSARRARGPEDPELGPNQFWREFRFELRQQGEAVPGTYVRDNPIYALASKHGGGGLMGTNVYFEYPASKIKSEEVEVEVTTPDGQHVVAKFDLAKLR